MSSDRSVIADSLGVGLATGVYGVSFGAIATASGLSVVQASVMSLLIFTGASQFAFVGVIAAGGAPLAGAATAVLLGSRNLFYGVSLAPHLKLRGAAKAAAAHVVIDESTAMAVTRETSHHARLGFHWTGWSIFILWNLSTFIGALAGNAIGDPRTYGLDAAVGAAFLGLLWPRLDSMAMRLIALIAAAAALGLIPFTAAGMPIILGGGFAIALGMAWPKKSTT
ncbi:MAG: AzlC family ABC transporter permease [Actinomycetota bacterium]|nr:AzlC family ABC transporter permease [Actinomycetota bacterium]